MTDNDSNSWNEHRLLIVSTLERLERGQSLLTARIEETNQLQTGRLDAIERLIAEGRGAWKVAVVIAGFVGALLSKLLGKVIAL
jgi:hypothetical protein